MPDNIVPRKILILHITQGRKKDKNFINGHILLDELVPR